MYLINKAETERPSVVALDIYVWKLMSYENIKQLGSMIEDF